MVGTVQSYDEILNADDLAVKIVNSYSALHNQHQVWIEQTKELRNYIFATDTHTTSNSGLPWKNSTTIPKICQIRDNLHSNYIAALFPNDDWLRWEAADFESNDMEKASTIEAYMKTKLRESNFQEVVSRLLYDYIDYGNAFADCEFVNEDDINEDTGEVIKGYIGPRALRVSPYDIVFNPAAARFKDTPKYTRYVKDLGELQYEAETQPNAKWKQDVVQKVLDNRTTFATYEVADWAKAEGIQMDGFGSLQEYYGSGTVELIEFEGSTYDEQNGELLNDYIITVVDRAYVVRKIKNPRWLRGSTKVHAGWRLRPDNLYAMGPLDNLVGMQYRIDHLENLKADVFDMIAHPPLKIRGDVDDFEWGPNAEIDVGEDGDVEMMKLDATALNADFQIQQLMQTMEEMAGAPKQAMGVRTPGEKTAFEVQQLENAAGRIFQEKTTNFEVNVLEPLLNNMLEMARREFNGADTVRVIDDELGLETFINITKDDLVARGKLRPVGARHFAAQSQLMQNINGIFNSPLGQAIAPHISNKKLAVMVEDILNIERYELVKENVAIFEQMETQRLVQQGQEDLEVESMTPVEEEDAGQEEDQRQRVCREQGRPRRSRPASAIIKKNTLITTPNLKLRSNGLGIIKLIVTLVLMGMEMGRI